MKYLLHIDTSTDIGFFAISCNGEIILSKTNTESRNHAATINVFIQDVIDSSNISFKDLSAVVVCAGPGSYTGLRIGMATAKGICYALDIPLYIDDKLTLLAYHSYAQQNTKFHKFIVMLLARENEFFVVIYDKDFNCTLAPQHVFKEQLIQLLKIEEKALIISNIDDSILSLSSIYCFEIERNVTINPFSWAKYAYKQLIFNKKVNLFDAEPIYLKQVYTHN